VLSEVEQTVDDVVIIANGRLVRACPLSELTTGRAHVVVRTPSPDQLAAAIAAAAPGAGLQHSDGALLVEGLDSPEVGRIAHGAGVELHELRPGTDDLEQVFLALTTAPTDGASS
jgi:ABC-2 type transport system ATP-binding protein